MTVLGKGTRLIGGTHPRRASREDLERCCSTDSSRTSRRTRCRRGAGVAGLQELGLPYAADAAVTRHLARFLSRQAAGGPAARRFGAARADSPARRMCCSTAAS